MRLREIMRKNIPESIVNNKSRGLRANEAAPFIGVSKPTLYRLVAAGKLPQGIRLGKRCTVWQLKDLEAFLENAKRV
jgi:excisionase family DNA binding protein